MDKILTSNEVVEDGGETQTIETTTKETEGGTETAKDEEDYKVKFSESSREAQRLYGENKNLKDEMEVLKTKVSNLSVVEEKELAELKEANPELYEFRTLKKSFGELQKTVLSQKEELEIAKMLEANPDAKLFREAIKKIGRAEPNRSYDDIWAEEFKPLIETKVKAKADEIAKAKGKRTETGKGSMTDEPISDLSLDKFSKLSLVEKKAYLVGKGL